MNPVNPWRPGDNPLAPWHMWGTGVTLRGVVPASAPAITSEFSKQLLRVNYKRPEHWRFWVQARLITGDVNPGPGDLVVHVGVDFILGVGRSVVSTKISHASGTWEGAFIDWRFNVPAATVPGAQLYNERYTTTGYGFDYNPTTGLDRTQAIQQLVAQDIQAEATLVIISGVAGQAVEAEVTAFVAPNVHLRPDWFADTNMFRGNETGGT